MGNLLIDDLNTCLAHPRDQQEEHLETVIASHGLAYQAWNFSPRRRYRAERNWKWRMWREGKNISGRGDYILGTRQLDFYKVGIMEPRIPTDHRMVLYQLIG